MTAVFVTSTGTDVGKTYITCAIIEACRARGAAVDAIKPALSDYQDFAGSDAGVLLAALGKGEEALDEMSPMRFAAALAPPSAAKLEGKSVDQGAMNQFCRTRMAAARDTLLLIEGVGGVMSPMADNATCLDLISDLEVPALLVVGSYLGSISHTLTAIETLRARYAPILGVVISQSEGDNPDPQEVVSGLEEFAPGIPTFVAPRGQSWDASALVDLLLTRA